MRVTLALLSTFAVPALAQSDFPDCSPNATKPLWAVENIHFNSTQYWTTPAHGFGSGQVSFSLSSNARDFVAQCNATSSQIPTFFNGYEWYPCQMPESALPSDEAWFKFNSVGGKLELNQTYTCWEELGPTLVRYTAYGFNNAALHCRSQTTTNPNWNETGGVYQTIVTDCKPPNLQIEASEISAVA